VDALPELELSIGDALLGTIPGYRTDQLPIARPQVVPIER
jgi:hypothetical protein